MPHLDVPDYKITYDRSVSKNFYRFKTSRRCKFLSVKAKDANGKARHFKSLAHLLVWTKLDTKNKEIKIRLIVPYVKSPFLVDREGNFYGVLAEDQKSVFREIGDLISH